MKFLNSSYSLYKKMVVYISVLIACIILLQSFVLNRYFESQGSRITLDANLNILSQISYSANYMNDAVRSFAATIFSDPRNLPLLYDRTVNPDDAYAQMKEIDTMVNQSSYIYSVYLYNGVRNEFYSTKWETISGADQFIDRDMAERMLTGNLPAGYVFSPIPRQIPLNHYQGEDRLSTGVFTYLIFDRFYDSDRIRNAIIVNVKVDYLTGVINALKTKGASSSSPILIAAGDRFLTGDLHGEQPAGTDAELLGKIRESAGESGYFKHASQGRVELVTYAASDIPDWKFVSITPYKDILKDMDKVRTVTYLACLAIVALGLALAYLLAKHLYSPIRFMIGKVGKATDAKAVGKELSDIDFLSEAFTDGIESSRKLRLANYENSLIHKQQALLSLLTNENPESAAIDKMIAKYGIGLVSGRASFVCNLAIDREETFQTKYSLEDQKLYRYMVGNAAGEMLGDIFHQESVILDNGRMTLILQLKEQTGETSQNSREGAVERVRRIQLWCGQKLGLSLTASIGYEVPGLTEIGASYRNAIVLAKYRLMDGNGAVITPERLDALAKTAFERPVELEKQLDESLNAGKTEEAAAQYFKIVQYVGRYAYDDVASYLLYFSYLLYTKTNELEARGYEKPTLDFAGFTREIMACETMDEVNGRFIALFETLTAIVRNKKFRRKNALAEKIVHLLETEYADSGLCQEGVAGTLNVSRDYVGRIFKEAYGQSFAEYLNDIRLNKAAQMLVDTKASLSEITDAIGWENKNYFYTMFKAKFGMTTSEYRTKLGP